MEFADEMVVFLVDFRKSPEYTASLRADLSSSLVTPFAPSASIDKAIPALYGETTTFPEARFLSATALENRFRPKWIRL